jgi:hypothetical protein
MPLAGKSSLLYQIHTYTHIHVHVHPQYYQMHGDG